MYRVDDGDGSVSVGRSAYAKHHDDICHDQPKEQLAP